MDPAERGRNKKQVVLQMLILQLASALRWQLKEIDDAVNLAMQHTLLDILLTSTGKVGSCRYHLYKGFCFFVLIEIFKSIHLISFIRDDGKF